MLSRLRPSSYSLSAALIKAAPFVLGAAAAAVWLRGRHAERPALPERAGIEPPRVPAPPPAPAEPRPHATGRFRRRRSIDIVTVVDDLLGAAR